MARILALSSQVARGHVGLSAIVPVLQALGHDVIALPTVLLSNHPGHPRFAGDRIAPDLLRRMLDVLDANGWLRDVDAVITGYLPSGEHVATAEDAVRRVQTYNAAAVYLCDPVLGDEPKGLYIAEDAATAIRRRLVPLADVLKMNRFELAWLSGRANATASEILIAARQLGAPVAVVTTANPLASANIVNIAVAGPEAWRCATARRAHAPNGTGDAFGALLLGYRLRGGGWSEALARATAGVASMLAGAAGQDELAVVPALGRLAAGDPTDLLAIETDGSAEAW